MHREDWLDAFTADNIVNGDIIQQHGNGNIGKQVHTGSGDNVLSKFGPSVPQNVSVHGGDFVARDKTIEHHGDVYHNDRRRPDDTADGSER